MKKLVLASYLINKDNKVNVFETVILGVFDSRCKNVSKNLLSKIGCSEKLSKYACLNINDHKCTWDSKCKEISTEQIEDLSCEEQLKMPVSSLACSTLKNLECIKLLKIKGLNTGLKGDYKCIGVLQVYYSTLRCSQLGLTELACLKIQTIGEKCIFQNQICQPVSIDQIVSCNQKLNRLACLSIENSSLGCQWSKQICQDFLYTNQPTEIIPDVSQNVCHNLEGAYKYVKEKHQCERIPLENNYNIPCNTLGLSKEGCLKIKIEDCIFYQGTCQELSEQDLKTYSCNMDLNEMACINLKTEFQFCKWNGFQCARLFMNQDLDCPLKFEDQPIKVNGNVCQAISKLNVLCKYDLNTNLCVNSTPDDDCDTPFINQKGCISINNVKNKKTCKWTNYQCISVQVISYFTTCESLQYANPQACSQVFENNSRGCYYNQIQQKCVTLQIDDQMDNNTKLFLETISCNNPLLGLNRVICTSIKTTQTPCRWYKDQCILVKEDEIRNVPCDSLEYANDQVCAFVEYQKQKCSYNKSQQKCVDYIKDMETCNQAGLNQYACKFIKNNCYFENNVCQNIQIITNNLKCTSNSPSEQLCKDITTEGQFCKWDTRYGCVNLEVPPNIPCSEFKNVNINVCTQIIMSNPHYDPNNPNETPNWGVCQYNYKNKQCEALGPKTDKTGQNTINDNYCQIENHETTKCCTDVIGINSHACSLYSSKDPGTYCYFKDGKCRELTKNEVDITDPEQVKNYFNELRLPCPSLSKNSCHMIDWSESQRCFYDGKICIHFDQQHYNNLSIVIQEGHITNEFLCLSLQAKSSDKVKYFTYDAEKRRCQILTQTSFKTCEDVNGNRNACLRFTEDHYCKWDTDKLKCITIHEDELYDIKSCDLNTNIKACNNNKYQACYFNYDSDVCMKAPTDIRCGDLEEINEIVCKSSKKEPCEYSQDIANKDKKKCYILTTIVTGCTSDLIVNSKGCYKNFQGDCRWNQEALTCYQNQDEISSLGCQDNLNKVLCLKVTKEACVWNHANIQCERFQQVNHQQFLSYNSENLYNQEACLLINSEGYYHDQNKNLCVWIKTEDHLKCSDYKMNKYACLYLTRGFKCYFKDGKCLEFVDNQNICDAGIDINIEVCMNIPKKCYFDINSLKCVNAIMDELTTCQSLFISQFDKPDDSYPDGISKMNENKKESRNYNKLACSSINQNNLQEFGEEQCHLQSERSQQCNYQNKCFWDINAYNCKVFLSLESVFIKNHVREFQKQIYVLKNTSQLEWVDDQNQNCSQQVINNNGVIRDQIIESRCFYTNEICSKDTDCPQFYNYTENYVNYNSLEALNNFINNQTIYDDRCIKYCSPINTDCNQGELKFSKRDLTIIKVCKNMTFYEKQPICYLIKKKIPKCENIYSKAICLEDVQEKCYFDLNQGGCIQFKDNEHKLPSCSAIQGECKGSFSQKAICQIIEVGQPQNCYSLPAIKYCSNLNIYKAQQYCLSISQQDVQPSLCAQALDKCRFDGTKCVSTLQGPCNCDQSYSKELCGLCNCTFQNNKCINRNNCVCNKNSTEDHCKSCNCTFKDNICVSTFQDPCICDRSYSKELCELCKCNFEYLGYCQKQRQPPQLREDKTNQHYLCQEANLFGDQNIQEICGSVEQACRFKQNTCEDATHLKCEDLINFTVSEFACLRCKDEPMKYITEQKKCEKVKEGEQFDKCQNLNYLACIRNTSIQCYWIDKNCKELIGSQEPECSLRNYYGCIKETTEQMNLCWFNPESKLCEKYSPLKGKCLLYKNKSTCMLSMVESCKWNGQICQTESNPQKCDGLNKYGCLNFQQLPCVWSDNLLRCELAQFSNNQVNCTQFLENQSHVSHMNAQTCTQIEGDQSCILGNNHKCRQILEPQFYGCETQGLNQKACLSKTKDACAFINKKCTSFLNTNQGCQTYLNEVACLNYDNMCQYGLKGCENAQLEKLQYSSEQYQREQKLKNSSQYCKLKDSTQNFFQCLIYVKNLGICIDITERDANVPNCGSDGINKYACLSQTLGSCQYLNSKCQEIKNEYITSCKDTFNWVACLSNKNLNCKFMDYKCQPILQGDSCQSLYGARVNPISCAQTSDIPCKYNSNTQGCIEVIINNERCSTLGLNEKACVFNTSKANCKFSSKECKMDFEKAKCTDKLNKNVCLGLKDQYCYFHEIEGCKEIDSNILNTSNCSSETEVTAITCSLATDKPCFYDQTKKICKIFVDSNFEWENHRSFNKLTCQQIESINTYWQGGCLQATNEILTQLQCDDQLNKGSCLKVKTQSQLCQYRDKKCETYSQGYEAICEMITDINNGIICSLNTSKPCQYDAISFQCKKVLNENSSDLNCSEREKQFYNKEACELNENCIFMDQKCQQKIQNNLYYCQQAQQIENCRNVLLEGCYRNSQQRCQLITSELQKTLNCSDIENQVGCKQLQTKGQYCRYYDNKCQNENIQEYKVKNCKDIKMINNYVFCEQTQDIGCIYDPLNNSCIESKQEQQDLTCPRGLNKLACIPLNSNTNQCQFFNYCYGFNSDILNCNNDDHQQCCQKALTIQSCLFQTKFKCQWNNNNKCTYYDQQINQKLECNTIQNASRNVCYSLLDNFCIFDHFNFKCIQIIPLTCDSVQSAQQCKRIPNIPCYWNQDQCQLKQQDLSDTCQFISQNSGNHQACIQIKRPGQMCIFNDYQCLLFQEIQNTDNCLHNINQNACLQQTNSQCYWDLDVSSSEYNYVGICKKFDQQQQSKFDCQSNLSFQSCLAITKVNSYCWWKKGICQKIQDEDLYFEKLPTLLYVNRQTCHLFADAKFIYDEVMYKCINNQTQSKLCTWNVEKQECIDPISKYLRKNVYEINQKQQIASASQSSTMAEDGPCGIIDEVCDYIDVKVAKCDHKGLNKYACLNITTQPCIWTKNKNNDIEHCELMIPEGNCEEQNQYLGVNALLCSMVQEFDPCSYDSQNKKCKKPDKNLTNCNVEGINVYGCVQMKYCYFQKGTCKLFDPNLNLSCQDVQYANELVCAQIKNGGCKLNLVDIGCIQSSILDTCSTQGININGCNSIEQCQWKNEQCLHKIYLEKQKVCSENLDEQSCNSSGKCYFEQSIFNEDEYTCKERHCNRMNKCNYELYKGKICFLNLNGKCMEATSCEEIKSSSIDCSQFYFNNLQCVSDGNSGCTQFQNCENLSRIQCAKYSKQCALFSSCVTKLCHHIKDQYECINYDCTWIHKQCINQIRCSEIEQEKDCNKNQYKGQQCSWNKVQGENSEREFCSSDGCSYLSKNIECHGTQVGSTVCILTKDLFCLSCEQIVEIHDCLEKVGYCSFDTENNKCISQTCENFNQQNCQTNRCFFSEKYQVDYHNKLLDLCSTMLVLILKDLVLIIRFMYLG
ncbi:unnamed protein product (macronuclear) [Paramecium tetraurelia]|uniref:Uncharacterized protein n=1 Tax=Paramecium tetraurelia TaxID=5888 RepID=A0C4M0_PARTE|nr:uncharacterized protein GSPATT00006236001 [Paramecium tetraurelia]CAK65737.1 unnamed protein product [Paramecium tetraurelia]|eukprot:XP_001433134.1 hypothetical protein (macronuclear) [Paramecium tetraurelia strain d4-2]